MERKIVALAAMLMTLTGSALANSYDDLNAGIQHYNARRWSDAAAQFDKALAGGDLDANLRFIALFDRARSLLSLGHLDQAVADYTAALELRPSEIQVLVERSQAYLGAGKFEQAGADIDRVITARPAFAHGYGIRAVIHVRRGRAEQSRQDFQMVAKLAPANTRNLGFGIVNWVVGQVDAADDIFSDLARRGGNKNYAWLWYALTQARLGKSVPQRALPDTDLSAWPGPIISFLLGKASQDSVFAAANQGEATTAPGGQICEANFYVGEWLLQHHDQAAAKPLLEKAAAICPPVFVEWMPAQLDSAALK